MSENLEDNEPRIIPPAVGNTQNEHVEPLIGTEPVSYTHLTLPTIA